jgi:hypothetical protein
MKTASATQLWDAAGGDKSAAGDLYQDIRDQVLQVAEIALRRRGLVLVDTISGWDEKNRTARTTTTLRVKSKVRAGGDIQARAYGAGKYGVE